MTMLNLGMTSNKSGNVITKRIEKNIYVESLFLHNTSKSLHSDYLLHHKSNLTVKTLTFKHDVLTLELDTFLILQDTRDNTEYNEAGVHVTYFFAIKIQDTSTAYMVAYKLDV